MKKLFLLMFVVASSLSVYSQAAVIDAAAQKQLTTLNASNKTALAKLGEQVGTAAKQLSQLEKTYETVKATAEKVEKVNSSVQSFNNMSKYISKQKEIINNINIVANSKRQNISKKQLQSIVTASSESLKKIQSFLQDGFFNLNDKERIDLIGSENKKLEINLIRSKLYANSVK